MALTDENGTGTTMLVQPAGFGGNGNGNGFMDGSGWWILLLFILLGGWGNGNNGFAGGGMGGGGLYPWMNQSNQMNEGFQNQLLNDNITSIRDGVFGINTQLCNGFAGVNSNIANGFAQAEIAENSRQMASMNQNFALQSAMQNCCCETQRGIEGLRYTVATEACADRSAISDALQTVIAANTASTQRILDQMCADKIDQKNDTIAQLRSELLYARGQASQDVQTAQILAGQVREIDGVYNRLSECPIPTVPVYGRQNIFTCGNNGCGCGCGG